MRALVDTHVFLWIASDVPRLSDRARQFLTDGTNETFLSAASAWEIGIKAAKGVEHLALPEPAADFVRARMARHSLYPLPISVDHALIAGALPHHHRDPFDRLLIAQSQAERLPIITADPDIARYDVEIIW